MNIAYSRIGCLFLSSLLFLSLVNKSFSADIFTDKIAASASRDLDFCTQFLVHGKYEKAIEACSTQILNAKSEGKLAILYYLRSRAYEKKGENEKATADLKKSLELDSKLYLSNISLGMIYNDSGYPDKAIAEFNRALESKPDSPYLCAVYTNRGNAYKARGDFDSAIVDYNRCIESNPNNDSLSTAFAMRCSAYLAKGKYDLATIDCNKAIELNPKLWPAYNQRGLLYYFNGKYDQAIADFNNAINFQQAGVILFGVYANRGNALKAKGQLEQAIADYNIAVELNRKIPNVHYILAATYSLARRIPEACVSLQNAIDNGYINWSKIKSDPELDNIRDSECYKKITSGK